MFLGVFINYQLEGNFVSSLVINLIALVVESLTMGLMMPQMKYSYMFAVAIATNCLIFSYMYLNTYTLLPQKGVLKLLMKKEKNIIGIMVFLLLVMVLFLYVSLSLLDVDIFMVLVISLLEGFFDMVSESLTLQIMLGIMKTLTKIIQMF